ncbi:MAG TPA: hypothetical protein VLC48_09160 [Gemmatimonadota bacterium]|nr:hypothetical protein [Gemmatimonadota bacterium]
MLRELLGFSSKKSFIERLADRLVDAVEQAAGSVERTTGRAAEYAEDKRQRAGARLREAGDRARAGREAVSERVATIQQRAAELRERREQRRELRQRARTQRVRRRHAGRARPMQLSVCRDDRVVLRGRQPIDVRMTDGGTIRYRYHERPSFWLRAFLRATGRQVWPRR